MILPLNLKTGQGDVVDGIVGKANERGVLLAGEDVWINVSRYAQPRPNLPNPGERVRLYLDGQGFIRQVDVLPMDPYEADVPPPDEPSRQLQDERTARYVAGSNDPTAPADKDVQIRRMNALSTATAILSSGGQRCDPADVLALAARLEAWVIR